MKKCLFCELEFKPKTKNQKYCCRFHQYHSAYYRYFGRLPGEKKPIRKFDIYLRQCKRCAEFYYSFFKMSNICLDCDKGESRIGSKFRTKKQAIKFLKKMKGGR